MRTFWAARRELTKIMFQRFWKFYLESINLKAKRIQLFNVTIDDISSNNDVDNLSERFCDSLSLGSRPAFTLQKVLEQNIGVKILFETEITELVGDKSLGAVRLKSGKEIKIDALFVEIGAVPRAELAKELGVALDKIGYIDVDPRTMFTNIDGIFAAGDVCNASGSFKQIITGAAQGAIAATSAFKDLTEHSKEVCSLHARST